MPPCDSGLFRGNKAYSTGRDCRIGTSRNRAVLGCARLTHRRMFRVILLCAVLLSFVLFANGFVLLPARIPSGRRVTTLQAAENDEKKFDVKSAEQEAVMEGLTHIKRNKYAPPPLEAAKMTQADFRQYMYKKMKEAERERKAAQGGVVGNAVSDDYINSLSGAKKPSTDGNNSA